MDAIKKKMQAMKGEKENAVERATEAEEQAKEANSKAEKVSHELNCSTDVRVSSLSSLCPLSSLPHPDVTGRGGGPCSAEEDSTG
jgi:hypothetical protein